MTADFDGTVKKKRMERTSKCSVSNPATLHHNMRSQVHASTMIQQHKSLQHGALHTNASAPQQPLYAWSNNSPSHDKPLQEQSQHMRQWQHQHMYNPMFNLILAARIK